MKIKQADKDVVIKFKIEIDYDEEYHSDQTEFKAIGDFIIGTPTQRFNDHSVQIILNKIASDLKEKGKNLGDYYFLCEPEVCRVVIKELFGDKWQTTYKIYNPRLLEDPLDKEYLEMFGWDKLKEHLNEKYSKTKMIKSLEWNKMCKKIVQDKKERRQQYLRLKKEFEK